MGTSGNLSRSSLALSASSEKHCSERPIALMELSFYGRPKRGVSSTALGVAMGIIIALRANLCALISSPELLLTRRSSFTVGAI